ncbi:hypothetical protein B0H11DRAFT_1921429 [Mycena galericulata]|nr:hypothetical protein B0H11DRAFT_1921429 [Mycena galericulata]
MIAKFRHAGLTIQNAKFRIVSDSRKEAPKPALESDGIGIGDGATDTLFQPQLKRELKILVSAALKVGRRMIRGRSAARPQTIHRRSATRPQTILSSSAQGLQRVYFSLLLNTAKDNTQSIAKTKIRPGISWGSASGVESIPPTLVFNPLASYQMEGFVDNIPEVERLRLMRHIRNIRDRSAAAEATYNLRLYKPEGPGKIYVQLRGNKQVLDVLAVLPAGQPVDHVDLKLGRTDDIERRRGEYARDCKGEEIVWCFYYETQHAKLLGSIWVPNARHILAGAAT